MSYMWPSDFMLFFGRNVWFDLIWRINLQWRYASVPWCTWNEHGSWICDLSLGRALLWNSKFCGWHNVMLPNIFTNMFLLIDAFSMWLFHTIIQLSTYLWNRLQIALLKKHWYKLFCIFSFFGGGHFGMNTFYCETSKKLSPQISQTTRPYHQPAGQTTGPSHSTRCCCSTGSSTKGEEVGWVAVVESTRLGWELLMVEEKPMGEFWRYWSTRNIYPWDLQILWV